MKNKIIILAVIVVALITAPVAKGTSYSPDPGPFNYLREISCFMRQYHDLHGRFAVTFEDLKSIEKTKYKRIGGWLGGTNYTYTITKADKKHFRVISENNKSLRNYETTDQFKYPVWFFDSKKEREKAKKDILLRFEKSESFMERLELIDEIKNFKDNDIKKLLLNTASDKSEDARVCRYASLWLEEMVTDKDKWIIEDLIKVLEDTENYSVKEDIINILKLLKAKKALPCLQRISKIKFDKSADSSTLFYFLDPVLAEECDKADLVRYAKEAIAIIENE